MFASFAKISGTYNFLTWDLFFRLYAERLRELYTRFRAFLRDSFKASHGNKTHPMYIYIRNVLLRFDCFQFPFASDFCWHL